MRPPLILVFCLSLCACASSRPKQTASAASTDKGKPQLASNAGGPAAKGKYVCTYEEVLGSYMRERVCRYVDDDNDSRDRLRDEMVAPRGMNQPQGASGR